VKVQANGKDDAMQWQTERMQQVDPGNVQRAMRAMFGLAGYLDQAGLEESLLDLVKIHASQINGCANCLDMHIKDARSRGESEQRLYLLSAWRESPFYSERERAALRWTEAVTLVADGHVPDTVYEEVRREFSDDELVALTMAVITINAWNRLSIGLRVVPGWYQPNDPAVEQLRVAMAS
jgi:AhpD family alkylhydroperoxidase